MRGFVIMLVIFSVMIAFVIFEEMYVSKVTKELSELSTLSTFDDESMKESLDKLSIRWEKEYKILVFFINQKELDNITLEIETAKSFYQSGDINMFKAFLSRAKDRIEKIPEY